MIRHNISTAASQDTSSCNHF